MKKLEKTISTKSGQKGRTADSMFIHDFVEVSVDMSNSIDGNFFTENNIVRYGYWWERLDVGTIVPYVAEALNDEAKK